MKAITSTWFECKVRFDQVQENGLQKKVTEQYVVDAISFSEAEKRIVEEVTPYTGGEHEVTDVRKAAYREVLFAEDVQADRWFKAKLAFITLDEKSGKEKRSTVTYLVQAASFDNAVENINRAMQGTMIDYEKSNITETKIMDVYRYEEVTEG